MLSDFPPFGLIFHLVLRSRRDEVPRKAESGRACPLPHFKEAGWSRGCISSTDHEGRQFRVVAAEREDAGRFIVHADERLIAFLELQAAIHRRFEFGWKVMRSSMFC